MSRIRTIKPEQPKDEELAALSINARYLFAFLPCHADREGRRLIASLGAGAIALESSEAS